MVPSRRAIPCQFLSIVDRPIEVKLFAQFDLPLFADVLGCEDQGSLHLARQPGLPKQQPSLDGLTKADFVGNQKPRRPIVVEAMKSPNLMGPGHDRRSRFAYTIAADRLKRGVLWRRAWRCPRA